MTLEEYRAAYDREKDFEPVTKELMQAWLDEGEDTFNELVKDMWIANYYKAESEG